MPFHRVGCILDTGKKQISEVFRMTVFPRVLIGLAIAAAAYAQPRITAVTNAASYISQDLPNGLLARGSFVVVKGSGLGPTGIVVNQSLPFPISLAGTSVRVTVGGTSVDGYMYYTSAAQIAFILPSQTPSGTGTITVTYNGQTSATAQVRVVDSAFGIFTLNQAGTGPGVFQNANTGTDQPVNTLTTSARPGQIVIIWGTGLGPVTTPNEAGQLPTAGDLPANVEVFVGGKRASVSYKGRSGCCIGLDQIVFTVPNDVPQGCYVPVVVRVNNVVSNFTTMSIAQNGGTCTDVTGLTGAQIAAAQQSGTFRTGSIVLTRSALKFSIPGAGTSFETTTDTGSAGFVSYSLDQLLRSQGVGTGNSAGAAPGSCSVYTYSGQTPGVTDVVQPTPLDAGPQITVQGPKGTKQLLRRATGTYSETLSTPGTGFPPAPGTEFLDPGQYTITGPGGAQVGAFTARITLPQLLNWTNIDAITEINRANDLRVTWTGGDPAGYVLILGASASASGNGAVFVCMERTSAGQFSVPSYVLSVLPATGSGTDSLGFLSVNSSTQPVSFTATGLDFGNVIGTSGSSKTVQVR
jgi:uncharacterized protein (TIGR03437 family)